MRHSKIDLTMNVYTDPKLLDVAGAMDSLPTRDLNADPSNERNAMRARERMTKPRTRTIDTRARRVLHQMLANGGNLCRLLSSHRNLKMNN